MFLHWIMIWYDAIVIKCQSFTTNLCQSIYEQKKNRWTGAKNLKKESIIALRVGSLKAI